MSAQSIAIAIRSRFKAQVETPQSLTAKVQYDNAPLDPPDDGTALWVRFAVVLGENRQIDIGGSGGTNGYRRVGVAYASIFAPIETGDAAALTLADIVAAAFRSVTAGGVTYRTPTIRPLGRQGAWWQINVECPFYADEHA